MACRRRNFLKNAYFYKSLLEKTRSLKTGQCDQKYNLKHRFSISTVYFTSKMSASTQSVPYLKGDVLSGWKGYDSLV